MGSGLAKSTCVCFIIVINLILPSLWCIDRKPLWEPNCLMYFCIKKYIGTQGEICRPLKIFLLPAPTPVIYATDRSKAVVPLCSFSVWLYGLYYGAFHVLKSSRALCPRVSSFILALWSPRLGKRERVCVFLVHLFACFVHVSFCHFSLPLGVWGWLQFVIVPFRTSVTRNFDIWKYMCISYQ